MSDESLGFMSSQYPASGFSPIPSVGRALRSLRAMPSLSMPASFVYGYRSSAAAFLFADSLSDSLWLFFHGIHRTMRRYNVI